MINEWCVTIEMERGTSAKQSSYEDNFWVDCVWQLLFILKNGESAYKLFELGDGDQLR